MATALGAVSDVKQLASGVEISCQNGLLRVEFVGETIRFWATQVDFGKDDSYSVIPKLRTSPNWEFLNSETEVVLTTDQLRVRINLSDSAINVQDSAEVFLLEQGEVLFSERTITLRSMAKPQEAIYGGGLRNGTINQRGKSLEFWNSNDPAPEMKGRRSMYSCIPFITLHSPGNAYGIFYDTVSRADLSCCNGTGHIVFESQSSNLKVYIIPGPSPAQVLERYTELTGRIELAPLWALHFGHSRYGIDTWEQLQHRVLRYRERGMPLSVVYLDLDYMTENKPWTWNEETFGKIDSILAWLKSKNIHVVLIMDPLIPELPDYAPFQELLAIDGFCSAPDGSCAQFNGYAGRSRLPEIFRQDVFEKIASWFQRWAEQYGVSWWLDKTEPALCAEDGVEEHRQGLDNDTLPADAVVHQLEGRIIPHTELHNAFGLRFAQAAHYGATKAKPNQRPFVIVRSGCAGSQRFGWTWTGDNYSDEGSLANGIRQLLTMGLSGWPLTGTNIGGFFGTCNPQLWARWMQLGMFSPLFWSHSIDPRKLKPDATPDFQTPWSYGEQVRAISRSCLELRVRLLPHTNDLMWEAMLKGTPLMRPMFLDCWQSELPNNDWIDLQYRWGDFLVAPVTKINDTGRQVFLPGENTPRGSAIWYDFFTGTSYQSGSNVFIDAPLERFPLLIPGGGIVPMWDLALHADDGQETLVVNVYSTGAGKYTHFMDDGESNEYKQGETPTLIFDYKGNRKNGKLKITLKGQSAYSSILVRLRMVDAPDQITLNGAPFHFHDYRPDHGGSIDVILSSRALERGSEIEYCCNH